MAKKDYLNLRGLTTYDSESKQYIKDQISDGIDNLRTTAYKTEAEWSKSNPVLKKGEWAYSSDKAGMYKLGNGTSKWSELGYNHVTWANVEGKPSTFSPTAHKHTKSDITDFPSTMKNPNALTIKTNGTSQAVYDGGVAKEVNITPSNIGLGNVNNTADKDKSVKYATTAGTANTASNVANGGTGTADQARHVWFSNTNPETTRVSSDKFMYNPATDTLTVGNITGKAGSVDWANVNGKPSTYTPSAHIHTKSQITDFPTSMPASDVYAWAKAASKPSYSWNEITGKPSSFTPASHTHAYITSSGRKTPVASGTEANLSETEIAVSGISMSEFYGVDNAPCSYGNVINVRGNGTGSPGAGELVLEWSGSDSTTGRLYYRSHRDTGSGGWGAWKTVAYTSDIPSTIAWDKVTGKPSTYPATAHTHDDRYYTESEINGKLSKYLPLTGGTVSGFITASLATANDIGFEAKNTGSGKSVTLMVGSGQQNRGVYDRSGNKWMLYADANNNVYVNGTASNVPWSGVTGKPSTFTPSSHTHDDRYYTETEINDKVTALNNSIATKVTEKTINTATDFNTFTTTGIYHIIVSTSSNLHAPTTNHGTLIVEFTVGTPYQIWIPDDPMDVQYKRIYIKSSSTWSGWTTQKLTDTVYTHPSYTAYTSGLYKITTNSLGHVTSATAVTKGDITALGIPGSNTDSKVLQTAVKASDYTNWRTVLWGASNNGTEDFTPTTVTDGVFSSQTLTFQPSTGTLKANTFKGNLSGNANSATSATTATKLSSARKISLTGSVTGSGTFDGSGDLSITTSTNHTHDLSTMINTLGTGGATPTDSDYYVCQWADGGTANTTYVRRNMSALWNYINSKLAKVATTGSYSSLSGTPTIGNGTITIKQNGAKKATFTMNQTGDTIVELTDTNTNTWRGIQNNLTSDSTSDSLAAAQGKALKGMVDAVNTKVDGIEVGGRNLLNGTNQGNNLWSNVYANGQYSCETVTWLGVNAVKMSCTTRSTSWKYFAYSGLQINFSKLKPGGSYVLSYDTNGGSSANFLSLMSGAGQYSIVKTFTQTAVKTSYGYRYTINIVLNDTLAWKDQVVYLENNLPAGGSVIIANIKLEEGTMPTAWTPAPEDIDDSISSLSSRITTNTNSISSLKTTVSSKLDTSTFENYKSHTHKSVIDSGNSSSATTFAYSKAGMNYGDYTWLAGWNGYELRAVNKSQFATSGHNHDSVYSKLGHTHTKSQITDFPTLGTAASKNTRTLTSVSHSSWANASTDQGYVPDMAFIAYWNGAYSSNGASNLAYCNKGAFGTIVTKNAGDYATAGHTHNYAGSSSVGGSANSAVKLSNARNIKVGGLSNFSFNFDGSGNVSVDDWGYGTNKYVTTDSVSAPYFRIAYTETKSSYSDASMILMIDSGCTGQGFGIIKVCFRNDNITTAGHSYVEIKWLVRQGFATEQFFVKGNAPAGGTQYADLYFKATGTYNGIVVTALSMGARGSKSRSWTFDSGDPRSAADIRAYSYTTNSSDGGTASSCTGNASTATKLLTARSINGTNFDGSGNITTANWGTVRTITIGSTGKSVNGSGNVSWSLSEIGAAAASHSHNYAGSSSAGGSATSAVKLDTATAGSATQPVYFSGGKPVACTYTLGKSVPSNAVFTDTNTWRGIQNNLTSDSTSDSLSAAQGKVLKGLVDGKASNGHTHSIGNVSGLQDALNKKLNLSGGTMTGAITLKGLKAQELTSKTDLDTIPDGIYHTSTDSNTGSNISHAPSKESQVIFSFTPYSSDTDVRTAQLALTGHGEGYIRGFRITDKTWRKIITDSNYTSYTVTKTGSGASGTWGINVTGSAGSVAWGNVSGRPSSLPASDVYAWAKASSKPSYSWSEITGKPSSFTPSSHTHSQYYDSGISRTANTVLAAPNGSNGGATFRKLVAADIPSLSYLPLSGGTVTGSFRANGDITTSSIELYAAKPYIDFHFDGNNGDYTSRIIENASGILNINGATFTSGGSVWCTSFSTDGGITARLESTFSGNNNYIDPLPGVTCGIKVSGIATATRFYVKGRSGTWLSSAQPGGAGFECVNDSDSNALIPGWRIRNASGAWIGASYNMDKCFHLYYAKAERLSGNTQNGTDADFIFNAHTGNFAAKSITQTSDERRKSVVSSSILDTYKDFFMKIKPFSFKWKDGQDDIATHLGIGAQSVFYTALNCGFEENDIGLVQRGKEYPGTSIPWSVSYTEFIPLNIAVTQDHETRIEKLERENEELKQQIKELKGLTA